jgi:23S rRNA (guanosine2251-2'-O)-methyltransferase
MNHMNHRHRQRPSTGQAGRHPERDEHLLIFGIHAVEAALANPNRIIRKVSLSANAERRLQHSLAARQLVHERVLPKDLDRRLGHDTVHQGALIEAEPLPEPTLAGLTRQMADRPLLVLDQVTDPHNVGAILRSAAVFGAAGLIMTRRHSPPLDGALAKAASGALEHVPVALVQNLARALDELKQLGVMVVGLDGTASEHLDRALWPGQVALTLGAEGRGLRELTRSSCDRLYRIATDGPLDSLNVSNAAAVALYWTVLQRRGAVAPPKAHGATRCGAP